MNCIPKGVNYLVNKLTNYPEYGSDNTNILDMLVSLLLVISPLLQHYKGIGVNAGICVLVICLPYLGIKLLLRFRHLPWKNLLFVLPLIAFQLFRVVAHGTNFMEIAHSAVLCGYFVAIALGGINLKYVARSALLIAMAAAIGIIIQSLCYYLFHFHLQLVATDLLLAESHDWVRLAQTGRIGITGALSPFYRPSAFFLEPSHMFLYYIPNLFFLLLTPDMNKVKRICAIILSVGLLLSTSGMGIALIAGIWLLHLGFGKGQENLLKFKHLFTKQNILRCVAFVCVFVVIIFSLPFARYGVLRIFLDNETVNNMIIADRENNSNNISIKPSDDAENAENKENTEDTENKEDKDNKKDKVYTSTAVSGRIKRALNLIKKGMSGKQYLVGVSDSTDVTFNLPGFFNTMYRYGIIGLLLSYAFYLACAIYGKNSYRWMAIIILGVSFFSAHTHGTFYMLFYVLLLINGLMQNFPKNNKLHKN